MSSAEEARKRAFGLRPIRSLQVLCQLEVLQTLHRKAEDLEANYFTKFLEEGLQFNQKTYERIVDVRYENLEKEVTTFEATLKYKLELEAKKELKGRIKTASGKTVPRREGLRSSARLAKPYKKEEPAPPAPNCEIVLRNLQRENRERIIPKGITAHNFIFYNKCKLMHKIQQIRDCLTSTLNRSAMNHLLVVWQNVMEYFNKERTSFVLMEAMLITSETTQINLAPLKFWRNLMSHRPSISLSSHYHRLPDHMETRSESTLIHFALTNGSSLTQIKMAGSACDSFLKVIVENCLSLKYLDISDSYVSDWGLYEISGLTVVQNRSARLPRRCKMQNGAGQEKNYVHEEMVKTKRGLPNLTHLIANNLKSISWPPRSSPKKNINPPNHFFSYHTISMTGYTDYINASAGCPKDSGFVLCLKHLPNLKVYMTEIGARAIDIFSRDQLGRKTKKIKVNTLPNLEMISERNMDKDLMKTVLATCPNIKSIFVKSAHDGRDEDWMECLGKEKHNLTDISIFDSHFKSQNLLLNVLEKNTGSHLSNLDLRGLTYMKMSWFQAIKLNCQSLNSLIIGITTKSLLNAIHMIDIEKDFNFSNGDGKRDPNLTRLQRFHLIGPFGPDVCGYMIKGSNQLKNLALTIDWLEPGLCSVQPTSNKDLLGKEYFNELKNVNSLKSVSELHLAAKYKKGRQKLDKDFAFYLLFSHGKSLKHLGNFKYWNFNYKDCRKDLAQDMIKQNLDLTFDEHLKEFQNKDEGIKDFRKCYVEGRSRLSCCDPRSVIYHHQHGTGNELLSDFFAHAHEVLAGLHGFFDDMAGDVSDSDDSIMDEEMSDDDDGDVDALLFFPDF